MSESDDEDRALRSAALLNAQSILVARQRAERAAAERATCPQARRAHEDMASAYAQLAENARPEAEQQVSRRPAA